MQTLQGLKAEMLAIARGERPPVDAGGVSYESAGAVLRLLTAENRELLAAIDRTHPESVAALAKQLNRAEPNVSRTLGKLEACGLVRLTQGKGKTKAPKCWHDTSGWILMYSPRMTRSAWLEDNPTMRQSTIDDAGDGLVRHAFVADQRPAR